MKSRLTKRSTYAIVVVLLLSTVFVFFQNFQKVQSLEMCKAYFSTGADGSTLSPEVLSLGLVTKKSQCLSLAVAEMASDEWRMAECTPDKAKVHLVLGDEELGSVPATSIPYEQFVAEFHCGAIIHRENSGEDPQIENPSQLAEKERFEISYNSNLCKVTESEFSIDEYSKFCPGCFSQIYRQIVDCESESCHKLILLKKVSQESGTQNELNVTSNNNPEYHCFKKANQGQGK